jgi:hypothetical protein
MITASSAQNAYDAKRLNVSWFTGLLMIIIGGEAGSITDE